MALVTNEYRKIYEVSRGNKYDEDTFRDRLDDLVFSQGEQDILAIARQIEKGGIRHYGGSYQSNSFKTNAAICITGLGFFGPAMAVKADYTIYAEIFEPLKDMITPKSGSRRIGRLEQKVTARRGEIYFVDFEKPVRLRPEVWYEVQFRLEGPGTARCEKTFNNASVPTSIGNVHFVFQTGSKQMPRMKFFLS